MKESWSRRQVLKQMVLEREQKKTLRDVFDMSPLGNEASGKRFPTLPCAHRDKMLPR